MEARADSNFSFRPKFTGTQKQFKDVTSDWPDEVIKRLTECTGGSFIWLRMIIELAGKLGPQAVDRLEDMLTGRDNVELKLIYNLYAKVLSDIFGKLNGKERKASRSVLAVLAKDHLRQCDLVELLSSQHSSVDETRRSVTNTVDQLGGLISMDNNQLLQIPHKSFSNFFVDRDSSLAAMRDVMPSVGTFAHMSSTMRTAQTSLSRACI